MNREQLRTPKGTHVRLKDCHWAFRLPLLCRYSGIVIGRCIWLRKPISEVTDELLRHELIHQEQMDRHGVFAFYLIYLKDYFKNLFRYRNHHFAYRNIPFEKEAFDRQTTG